MNSKLSWHIIGESIRGASHSHAGLPNQDYIDWLPKADDRLPLVVAVSDGHGSVKSFRSSEGARLAVETALQVSCEFLRSNKYAHDPKKFERVVTEYLPKAIVQKWREAVKKHLLENPRLSSNERRRLAQEAQELLQGWPENASVLVYGATLLITIVTETAINYLQLGDGDILTVSDQGEVTRPLIRDPRLIANETSSLASKDAWNDFRVSVDFSEQKPSLILMATDGYANSFVDEQGFLKVGSDFLAIIRQKGLNEIRRNLKQWLQQASAEGSGDDITVGIISSDGLSNSENLLHRRSHKVGSPKDNQPAIANLQSEEKTLAPPTPSSANTVSEEVQPAKGTNVSALADHVPQLQKKVTVIIWLLGALLVSNIATWSILLLDGRETLPTVNVSPTFISPEQASDLAPAVQDKPIFTSTVEMTDIAQPPEKQVETRYPSPNDTSVLEFALPSEQETPVITQTTEVTATIQSLDMQDGTNTPAPSNTSGQ